MNGLFVITLCLAGSPRSATPFCTCVPLPAPTSVARLESVLRTGVVPFEGRVVRIEQVADSVPLDTGSPASRWREPVLRATVVVQRQWTGAAGAGLTDTVVVVTPASGTACGLPLRVGAEWLFFGRRRPQDMLEVNTCGGNRPSGEAGSLRRLLDRAEARRSP